MTFDVNELDSFLLVASGVLLLAILAVRVSTRAGLPSLLLYLLLGVLIGEAGFGIDFDDAEVAYALAAAALAVILAEGGLTTSWREIRPCMRLGVVLATVGLSISIAIVAVAAHYLLGLDWQLAVLLGAATSATDAAAVFSVLRVVPLPRRVTGVLEAESGLNDAPAVVLVTLVASGTTLESGPLLTMGMVAFQLAAGVLVGLATGFGGAWVMRRAALPASGLYPLAVLSLALLAYAGGSAIEASGFAGVYVAALVLGNADLPHRAATRSFAEGFAWLAQIGLFVMLGLLLSPQSLTPLTVGMGLAAGVVLTFVARPVSVALSSLAQPMPWRELAFVSWAGMRGAVPIVFATIPLAEDVPGAGQVFNIVVVMVVAFTLLTGPTLPLAARVLRVARPSEPRDLELEAAPLERIAADLLQVRISPASLMHGVEVWELRLPSGASVSLVIREGHTLVPEWRTVLRHEDELLVVTPRSVRERTEERLRQVSRGGRLAQWRRDH